MEGRQAALLQEVGPRPVESAMPPKEDLQVELGSDNEKNETTQHLPPALSSKASPVKATPDKQPSSRQTYQEARHNSILRGQEAVRTLITSQEALKSVIVELRDSTFTLADRVQAIEQQMGTFAQFNEEIDQLGGETDFNGIAVYP